MPGFAQVWAADFEFSAPPGERTQRPVCGVFHELRTGQTIRLWGDELGRESPIDLGKSTLYVAFAAAAEMSCHMVLGWPLPVHVLDLYVEQRNIINGTSKKPSVSLISTLSYWGLDHIGVGGKSTSATLSFGASRSPKKSAPGC